MRLTLRQAIIIVLLAIVVSGGYLALDFWRSRIFKPEVPLSHWKIGFLLIDKDVQAGSANALKKSLQALGYTEGVNVTYVEMAAAGDKANFLDQYAKELNEAGLDIIVTGATSATVALKKLTDLKTPVFFLAASQPSQIVKNLQSPEGLITGIGEGGTEFVGKRLEFLKEIQPSIKKVVNIIERGHSNTPLFKEKASVAARRLGLELIFIDIGTSDELLKELPRLNRKLADAYINCERPSNSRHIKTIVEKLKKEKMLSIMSQISFGPKIGALMAYADDREETIRQAAKNIDLILKKSRTISQVPVEFATRTILEINLKTAKDIGVTIPEKILLQANKVYNE